MTYFLTWYDKTDELIGEILLPLTEDGVRKRFKIPDNESIPDSIEITDEYVAWIQSISDLRVKTHVNSYFIETYKET